MSTLAWILGIASLIAVASVALALNIQGARDMFDTLTADETDHEARLAPAESLEIVPDGFTCLRCLENPALPSPSIWCAVCTPVVDSFPSEPIEHRPIPVTEWDAYAVTYRQPARSDLPLTEWFAAETEEAAAEAALEGNPGATVIEVLNVSGNAEYERGAL
ncbi:hypothetical protein ACFPJ1_40435 [Kribbella qitaiheensis]|uniref:hypothetical protein n=1 Tax=Kribbella qitaiheensis TaxID=1544730 RepID=UPI003624202F